MVKTIKEQILENYFYKMFTWLCSFTASQRSKIDRLKKTDNLIDQRDDFPTLYYQSWCSSYIPFLPRIFWLYYFNKFIYLEEL